MLTSHEINIGETKENFLIDLAASGSAKEDFHIDVNGNMLTIKCENEKREKKK